MMVDVRLKDITKVFGKVVAVRNMNLEIRDKEFFAILGPSGCGKTTTLRIIAGLEKPTKGRVYFDNQDVTSLPAKFRDVAMVPQFYALYPTTVYNNIALPLRSRGVSKEEVKQRVREVAELLGLTDKLHLHIDKLSIGDKQKVSLARAIVRKPKLYLLDEPLTILDPVTRIIIRSELKSLQKRIKQTIIYVTHDQIEAMSLADRIAVMNMGVIEQVGTPYEIYDKPSSRFVGWFIGEPGMNFLEAEVDKHSSAIKLGSQEILQSKTLVSKLVEKTNNNKVVIGVRPEYIYLEKNPREAGSGYTIVKGVVELIEFTGTHYIVLVGINGREVKVKMNVEDYRRLNIAPREDVYLRIPLDKILFFDPVSEKRVL